MRPHVLPPLLHASSPVPAAGAAPPPPLPPTPHPMIRRRPGPLPMADVTAQTLGGALLDSAGRVVGMPVLSYSSKASARSSGVNFALPANVLREVVPKLIVYRSAAERR